MSARTSYRLGAGLAGAAILLVTGCSLGEPAEESSPSTHVPEPPPPTGPLSAIDDAHEVIVTELEIPWAIAFLPDGDALVTERASGRILRIGPTADQAGPTVREVQRIDGIDPTGEGGLLGIAVSPEYQHDQSVFVYYSTHRDNRIARLTLGEPPEPILTDIPHAARHNGGRLAFGPDGYLYVGTGDAGVPERAQDQDNLAGKILRLTTEGTPAPGNPFGHEVWALGLRNPQGLAWDQTGRLWATEFGERTWDEVNLIEPGGNYGWPVVEGRGEDERFRDPELVWPTSEASCSGLAVLDRTLIAACLRGQRLWTMEMTDSGAVLGAPQPSLVEEYGRLRAVVVAPDGSLWLTTSNRDGRLPGGPAPDDDRIIRLLVADSGAGRT